MLALCGGPNGFKRPRNPGSKRAAERDGQHDFDFEFGSWKIHLKRRLHPLTGSNTWVEFDGTSVTRKLWDGRAQIEEFETDGAAGHVEGLTLRTYNPQTRDWRLYWANSKDGVVVVPQIGQFKNGLGEFYAQDTLDGKIDLGSVHLVEDRYGVPHFEQSFSDDWRQDLGSKLDYRSDARRRCAARKSTSRERASSATAAANHRLHRGSRDQHH